MALDLRRTIFVLDFLCLQVGSITATDAFTSRVEGALRLRLLYDIGLLNILLILTRIIEIALVVHV